MSNFGIKRYLGLISDLFLAPLQNAIRGASRTPESDIESAFAQFLELSNRTIRTDLTDVDITDSAGGEATLDPTVLGEYAAISLDGDTTINLEQGEFGDEFHLEVNHNSYTLTLGTGISSTSITGVGFTFDAALDFTLYTFLKTSSLGTADEWTLVAAKDFYK